MFRHLPASRLPMELIHQIIDELQGDNSTLLACALVHSSLCPHAKAVLYRTLCVDSQKSYNSLTRVDPQQEERKKLLSLARLLVLDASDRASMDRGGLDPEILSRFMFAFADVPLPNLYYLALFHLRVAMGALWNSLHSNPFGRISKTFATVTSLRMERVQFVQLRDFARLICALSRLDTLILNDISIRNPTLMTPATGDRLALSELSMRSGETTTLEGQIICEWLAQAQVMPSKTLHTVSMTGGFWDDNEGRHHGACTLLERLGESVHFLTVETWATRTCCSNGTLC